MTSRLTDFEVLTFDCYGTLIDWESGIWDALQPLLAANGRSDVVRDDALRRYATLESAQEAATAEVEARPATDFVFFSMAEMAEAVRLEVHGA